MWRATSLLFLALVASGCPARTAVACNDNEDCGRNEECRLGFCGPIVEAPEDAGLVEDDAGLIVVVDDDDAGVTIACAPGNEMRAGGTVVCGNVTHVVGLSTSGGVRVDAAARSTPMERTASTGGAFTVR